MNDVLHFAFYYYYYYTTILAVIFSFSWVNLLFS